MDTHRVRSSAVKREKPVDKITGFDPVVLHAPFILRCCALTIDYIIFILVPALGLIFNLLLGSSTAQGNAVSTNIVWFTAVLLEICNLLALPALAGQTLGMLLSGIRIVRSDGREASVTAIVLRNTLGYLLTVLTAGIGFFIAAVDSKGRSLHDLVAGTVVVNAARSRRPRP
jgi:uncharacterized RDD family membrane protein YckC